MPRRALRSLHANRLVASLALVALAGCAARVPAASTGGAPPATPAPITAAQLAGVALVEEVALSPDGTTVAFASDRSGAVELWTAPVGGDRPVVPRRRTDAKEHVSGLRWAPDGSALVFEMDHGGDERPDLWILRGDGEPTPLTRTPEAERGGAFSPDGKQLAFEVDGAKPFLFNVARMDLATGAVTVLTHEAVNVVGPRWDPSGRHLVATRTPDEQRGDLLVIASGSGDTRALPPPTPGGNITPIDFVVDGRLLALATNTAGFRQLALVDAERGASTFVGPGDWDVERAVVGELDRIAFVRNVRGRSELCRGRLEQGALVELRCATPGGVIDGLGGSHRGHRYAIAREASDTPPSIELVDDGGARRTLVGPALGGVDPAALVRSELRDFASFDGRRIDAYLLHPPRPWLGTPPPAVVVVHGGPNGEADDEFDPLPQALAQTGFLVVVPNYRGSTGYGRAFEDLDNRDWGGGDLEDVARIVAALAEGGGLDARRTGIVGGSFGGYMALRAITARPELFAAAVESYGMPDLVEDFKLTEGRFGTWYATEMGDPLRDEKAAALFRDRSPIHALDRVRAPLLVLQGANDTNVPRAESDAVVAALRGRGATVDYTVYPDEGHGFTHREHRVDAMTRTVDWFVKYLGGSADNASPHR